MNQRWLILADDLTGAADSAIAFARRGMPARVVWGASRPEDHEDAIALAYDTATREVDGAVAARRHREVLQQFQRAGIRVYKKIDSTLRGHPAEEIAAMLDVMQSGEFTLQAVMAPSFPATGRTVRDGRICVGGVALPLTEFWPRGRDPALAGLVHLLATAGVPAHHVPLTTVRAGQASLGAAIAGDGSSHRITVAVCDAETDEDLDRIAAAGLDGGPTLFIGSAGLAHALAQQASGAAERYAQPHRRSPSAHGALMVIGSRAPASRAALAHLSTVANLRSVTIEPQWLAGDTRSEAERALTQTIADSLRAGVDVVVDIAPSISQHSAADAQLVSSLARLLVPAARQASALVATGGETAAALLAHLGVEGLQLLDEIEPGIALGLTLGDVSLPAVTKAGGFGNEECLKNIIARLRFIRQTGTVA